MVPQYHLAAYTGQGQVLFGNKKGYLNMNVNLIDEVPFSKDYNVDSLTAWETQEILDVITSEDKDDKKYLINIAVYTILFAVFAGLFLWGVLFALDWQMILNLDHNSMFIINIVTGILY